ncbi:hypothetical protein NPIL_208771, partial [Nephila pilipes]
MARTKQTSPDGEGHSQAAGTSTNADSLGDTAEEIVIEMADISATGSIGEEPSKEDVRKCDNINFAINQLVQTNNIIFTLEAKKNTILLFPNYYGPNELEGVRRELTRFKEERSKHQ